MSKNLSNRVSNPSAPVLINNVSNSMLCIPRDGQQDLLFGPGDTVQLTWAEFIKVKNVPGFGKFIKLHDSVVISDGEVFIKEVVGKLTEAEMIDILAQNTELIKEYVLGLNSGEIVIFKVFLEMREKLDIEREKCSTLLTFINENSKSDKKETASKKQKRGKSRPKNIEADIDTEPSGG